RRGAPGERSAGRHRAALRAMRGTGGGPVRSRRRAAGSRNGLPAGGSQFPSASSSRRNKRGRQLGTAWLRVATPFGHLMKQKKLRTHLTNQRELRLGVSQKFWSSGTCSSSHRGALLHSRAQCNKNAQRCKKQRTLLVTRVRDVDHISRACVC